MGQDLLFSQRIWFQVYGISEKKRYSQKRILVYNFGRDTSINSSKHGYSLNILNQILIIRMFLLMWNTPEILQQT